MHIRAACFQTVLLTGFRPFLNFGRGNAAGPAHLAKAVAATLAFPTLCAHWMWWDMPHKLWLTRGTTRQ